MKKYLIIILVLFTSLMSYSKTYNVSRNELINMVEDLVINFENNENKDEWQTLLNGTLAVETNIGQFKGKSKIGVAQMHKIAFIHNKNLLLKDKNMYEKVKKLYGKDPKDFTFSDIVHNHRLGILFMYLHYKYHKIDITKACTIKGAGQLWKKYYNTYQGKGTVERFIKVYNDNKNYFINSKIENIILTHEKEKEMKHIEINTRVMIMNNGDIEIYSIPIILPKEFENQSVMLNINTILEEIKKSKIKTDKIPIVTITNIDTVPKEIIPQLDIISAYIYKSLILFKNGLIVSEFYNQFSDIHDALDRENELIKEETSYLLEFSNNLLHKYTNSKEKIEFIDMDITNNEEVMDAKLLRLKYGQTVIHIEL